jgi:Protein of unknown function (DUF1559)
MTPTARIPRSAWVSLMAALATVGWTAAMVVWGLGHGWDPELFLLADLAALLTALVAGMLAVRAVHRGAGQLRGERLALASMTLAVVIVFGSIFGLPACQLVHHAALRTMTQNRLKQVTMAVINFADQSHGQLPPAAVRAKDGKPLLSWRVAILPFLNEEDLYREFRVEEAWDSPHHLQLLKRMPLAFRSSDPTAPEDQTFLRVFVGPGTAFERDGLRLPADFPDGTADTFLVVEAATPVPWTKPEELVYDPNGPPPELGAPKPWNGWRRSPARLFHAGFADGGIRNYPTGQMPESAIRAFITRNGGEPTPGDW